ncbi:serine/threonine-protein kinase [Rubripirellula amarantea]|nr:serine/threonine-protein kinase [Rubripirellula amarantea]
MSIESHAYDGLDDPTRTRQQCREDDAGPTDKSQSEHDDCVGNLPVIGTLVGDSLLLSEIARGAMGVVYKARQQSLDRMVAVKMVLEGGCDRDQLRQRFDNEARFAASLDHPGIVPVYEVGRWQGLPYFVMALVDGESLAERLRDGPLKPDIAAEIAFQTADAISHAHHHKIIHRDLKPANILINCDGRAMITDFGVSKTLGSSSDLTSTGELIGTPHYMPPEQAGANGGKVGPASDVYAIGAVLYAMLTGRPPFLAATPIDVVSQVLTQEPVRPLSLNSAVPIELDVITGKCLQKSPADRYGSASELANDLKRFLTGEPISARPPGVLQRMKMFLRAHVMLASVSGSAALLLILMNIVSMFALVRTRSEVAELTDALEVAVQMRQTERRVFASVTGRSSSNPTADQIASDANYVSFEIQRLLAAADHYQTSRPELSMQLLIAAIQTSQQNLIAPGDATVSRLRGAVALMQKAQSPDSFNESNLDSGVEVRPLDEMNVDELILEAQKRFPQKMSVIDRALLGLLPIDVDSRVGGEVNVEQGTPKMDEQI